MPTPADVIAGRVKNADAILAEHRDRLWLLGIRAAVLRAEAARLCRRSRWQARVARQLLQKHVLRGVETRAIPRRRKSARPRSLTRLVLVR